MKFDSKLLKVAFECGQSVMHFKFVVKVVNAKSYPFLGVVIIDK